jgi:hypothetical protein
MPITIKIGDSAKEEFCKRRKEANSSFDNFASQKDT